MEVSASVRPTRHRLLTAMGISACAIVVLLAALESLVDFAARTSNPGSKHEERLTVHIKKSEREPDSDFTMNDQVVRSSSQKEIDPSEFTELQQEIASVDIPEPPAESAPLVLQPETDWRAIANETAKASVDEYFRQEESRASMWRRSHSAMFQPANDNVAIHDEPILSDIRFKYRSRVMGLGINIGSCFIGIPVAGVPVEDRSGAITVFVCG